MKNAGSVSCTNRCSAVIVRRLCSTRGERPGQILGGAVGSAEKPGHLHEPGRRLMRQEGHGILTSRGVTQLL
jgi:hypothetical protein